MREWVPRFALYVVGLSALLAFGYWRISTHRRFRVRGALPTSARLETKERWYVRAALFTAVGVACMLARLSGAPDWTGLAGGIVAGAGFIGLAAALTAYLVERFRLPPKKPRH